MTSAVRIFHMAGMARSGETILLRSLSQHPKIKIVHNLFEKDRPHETALFRFLKAHEGTSIATDHRLVAPYGLEDDQSFVLKQGVWEHPFDFKGFILARNPLAIFASLLTYDEVMGSSRYQNWPLNEARLKRWLKDIEPTAVAELEGRRPVEQFAVFYNRRMGRLSERELPVVSYEDLAVAPEETLSRICGVLGLGYDPALAIAHRAFPAPCPGHGKTDLSRPINSKSVGRYKDVLTVEEQEELWHLVADVAGGYGYRN